MTLDSSLVTQGFWESSHARGLQQRHRVPRERRNPRRMLEPGESVKVPVYYAGLTGSPGTSPPTITFTSTSGFSPPITLPPSTGPPWRPDAARHHQLPGLECHLEQLRRQNGATWGSYLATFDANAAYLGRLGENVNDVTRLSASSSNRRTA